MRISLCLALPLSFAAACASDPPAPQIPLARLTNEGCAAYPAQPIARTCLPRVAAENTALALEVEERCGSCSSTIERCAVTVSGKDVMLSLDGQSCHREGPCETSCKHARATCRLPPLPAGRYSIRYADAEDRIDTLEVAAGGSPTCVLEGT